ncbi:MAG: phage tail length tape measure family protein [Pseudomonadota bacterium]
MAAGNATIGALRVEVGVNTAQLETGLKRAQGQLGAFAAANDSVNRTAMKAAGGTKALQQAGLNLSRQFTDIGVSLAGGGSPFLVLTQQLPQVADAFAVAKGQGLGFGDVVKGLGGNLVRALPLIAGVGAAVGVAVGAFALFERAVDKQTKGATTFGETWQATLNVIGKAIMDGPVGEGLRWLSGAFGATLDAITGGVTWFLDTLVGHFGAAYQLIVKNWRRLPEVFGVIVQGAANIVIRGVEGIVNKTIEGVNVLLKAAGKATIGLVDLPEIRLANAQLAAEYDSLAQSISSSFREGREGFFAKIVAETDRLHAANQKAKGGAESHGRALKALKKEADAAAEAFKRLAERVASFQASLASALRDRGLTELQKTQRDLREGLNDVLQLEQGLKTIGGEAARLNADVTEEWARAQQLVNVELERTPDNLKDAADAAGDLESQARDIADAFGRVNFAIDDMFRSIKSGDLGSVILNIQDLVQGLGSLLQQGPAGLASIGSIVANTIGGKGGRAIGGGLGIAASGLGIGAFAGSAAGAAALGSIGLGAGAIASIAGLAGPIGLAAGALYAAAKLLNIGGKPSNKGAGFDLVTGQISGNKRDEQTEGAARSAGEAILGIQDALKAAGIELTDTVRGLVIGTRDQTQIYLQSGKTLRSAVGDAGAAVDAALRELLAGAEFVSEQQKKLVDAALASGKGFEAVAEALGKYEAAQNISKTLADRILQLVDPKAYDLKSVKDAIADERAAAKKLADEGALAADQLAAINAQLDQLEGLQLDEILKRYGDAVSDATQDARAAVDAAAGTWEQAVADLERSYEAERGALEKTRDRLLQVADALGDFRAELRRDVAGGGDPRRVLAAARAAFAAAQGSSDPEVLAKLPELGRALVSASEAGAATAAELAADKAAVLRATASAESAARAQAQAIDGQIAALEASVAAYLPVNDNLLKVADALAGAKAASEALKAAQDNLAAVMAASAASIAEAASLAAGAVDQAAAFDAAMAALDAQAQAAPSAADVAAGLPGADDLAAALAAQLTPYLGQMVTNTGQMARTIDDVTQGGDTLRTTAAA